jgi:hypothetical protein
MSKVLEAPRTRVSSEPAILGTVRDPDCNLAIWERAPLDAGISELAKLECRIRFTADFAEIPERLDEEISAACFRGSPARALLLEDVVRLAGLFVAVMRRNQLRVRLENVATDSCRKFHADYVPLRLITTYHGAATQWVDKADAERIAEGLSPLDIRSMRAGDVGLFKGRLATRSPAIHRSPPLLDTGQSRLLLVIDPAEEH